MSDLEIAKNIEFRNNKNWNIGNTKTIIDWISSANLKILLLDTYLTKLRAILRVNTLWSLVISSITSTISLTQFTVSDVTNPSLALGIKIVIFLTSIVTSLVTGYIKVEKIQETIETLEQHKSEWLTFMYSLLSELQVGLQFRNDGDTIINTKKKEFNNVNSRQLNIPANIRKDVSKFLLKRTTTEQQLKRTQFASCNPCFRCSRCCYISIEDYNIETLNMKLSLYHSINKELRKELLNLMVCYPDQINKIQFGSKHDNSDLFSYTIIDNRFDNNNNECSIIIKKDTTQEQVQYTHKQPIEHVPIYLKSLPAPNNDYHAKSLRTLDYQPESPTPTVSDNDEPIVSNQKIDELDKIDLTIEQINNDTTIDTKIKEERLAELENSRNILINKIKEERLAEIDNTNS